MTSNFLSTATLQHEHVDDGDTGCGGRGGRVECIAVAVASVCGFAGNDASQARQRALEIVERRTQRQWSEEYDQHEATWAWTRGSTWPLSCSATTGMMACSSSRR